MTLKLIYTYVNIYIYIYIDEEKTETALNLRLNDHRKDTQKPNSILACKCIIIDKLVNLHGFKEALREMLVIRANFWIQKLKTLVSFEPNEKLSK